MVLNRTANRWWCAINCVKFAVCWFFCCLFKERGIAFSSRSIQRKGGVETTSKVDLSLSKVSILQSWSDLSMTTKQFPLSAFITTLDWSFLRLTQITTLARYLDNTTFFLTNIHNYLHFISQFTLFIQIFLTRSHHSFYSSKTAVRAVESSYTGVFNLLASRGSSLIFIYVSSWLRPFNIFMFFCSHPSSKESLQ